MDGFYNHEEDIHAKISEDILTDTADEYKTMSQDIVDYYAITVTEISKVSDIIHLSLEDMEVYTLPLEEERQRVIKFRDDIGEYDYNFAATELANIKEMTATLNTIISRLSELKSVSFDTYSVEPVITPEEYESLCNCITATQDGCRVLVI